MLTCSNNLVSEECTDIDSSATDLLALSGQDGEVGNLDGPSISVLRLAAITESDAGKVVKKPDAHGAGLLGANGMGASSASSYSSAAAAGIALTFTTLLVIV